MKINQLSLFLENKPGHLKSACKALADAGAFFRSHWPTQQFGILRLIVHDWQRPRACSKEAGGVVNVTEVVATGFLTDGGLAEVLDIIGAGS